METGPGGLLEKVVVLGDVGVPLAGDGVLVEDGGHGTHRLAGSAVDALIGVYVVHVCFVGGVYAVHWADIGAGCVLTPTHGSVIM